MRSTRFSLLLIFILTLMAVVVDLPENIPLKINYGKVRVNRITSPHIQLPFLNIEKKFTTHLGLDLLGGTQLVLEADMKDLTLDKHNTALESTREVIERRVNFFGVAEPVVQTLIANNNYRVNVELPGIKDIKQAVELLGQTAQLEFREFLPIATESAFFADQQNTKEVGITGKDLQKAEVVFDNNTGEPQVAFELTSEGGKKFAEVSTRLVGQRLAIFLDDFAVSAPVVKVPITDGKGVISGNFTRDEAKRLALQLSAGALPVPIKVIDQKNINATLGQDSVAKSLRAGIIGLALVALFMAIYYGYLGILADIALIIYALLTYAIFKIIPITLTLPGIAGFILSIGMAVDSNILIFERLKEELRAGRPWQIALELGFGRAWDSIRDANFTTIITAFILYNPLNWNFLPTSGLVRGFALTLALGVLVSLFTGIVVSRNLIRAFYRPKGAIK